MKCGRVKSAILLKLLFHIIFSKVMPRSKKKTQNSEEIKKKEAEDAVVAKKKQLIELVQGYPQLYDLSHVDYKNSAAKNVIWAEIAAILEEDGE